MRSLRNQAEWCRKVQYVLVGTIVLMGIAFYLFSYRPANSQLETLQREMAAKQQELDANRQRAKNLPTVALDVEKLRLKLDRFDKRLPKRQELDQFIKDITQLSHRSNLRKLMVQPGVPRKYELFAAQPISLHFEADFNDVFSFLRQTEEMPRLTRVQSISVRCVDSKLGTVEVQVSMNIFFMEG
jgi:Tfp pilus assembly protein PilO